MNQYILERWNAKINNGDTVYILGDMAMRGKNSALLALVAQLKGKKILFRGNHDDLSDYRYQRLFEEITDYREIADSFDGKTYKLCLMHYPILMWNGQHRGSILLYAHTHNTVEEAFFQKCVKELKAGNDEFKEAHDSILAKLKTLNMPEVDMFLEIYIPALGKSLDELNYYEIK